jgi:hypothetical protein
MKNRLAVVTAFLALIVIIIGAYLTGEIRVLPGTTGTPGSDPAVQQVHQIGGYAVAALALISGILAFKQAGGFAPLLVLLVALSGNRSPVQHAIYSQLLFADLVLMAVLTSKRWQAGPKPVTCTWRPLRVLGMLVPFLLIVQIGLGAAFRGGAMNNPISHVLNAFIVIGIILIAGVAIIKQHPDHPMLRPSALTLLITSGIQVLLGFAVYLILLISDANNPGLIITGALHVMNGALTLAAGVVFAMEVNRNLIQSSGA